MQYQLDNREREELQEYIDGLENNIEYFKQWSTILEAQRNNAESKVKALEAALIECIRTQPTTIKIN
jgi:hypothetical protein